MSNFNTSNELASQLIEGRYYQSNEPNFSITKIVFYHNLADAEDRIVIRNEGSDWAPVASRIQALLDQGYNYTTLPCEICGATELADVLHCDGCGEPIPHNCERSSVDEDGEKMTCCHNCKPVPNPSIALEDL